VDPNQVRFSQSSISFRFSDGSTIDDLAEGLRSGQVAPHEIPPLRLVMRGELYFSLDNRRLEAYRRAGLPIPWQMATPEEIEAEAWKFTTKNEGVSIIVRGEL
jgi:hypothetical protein